MTLHALYPKLHALIRETHPDVTVADITAASMAFIYELPGLPEARAWRSTKLRAMESSIGRTSEEFVRLGLTYKGSFTWLCKFASDSAKVAA